MFQIDKDQPPSVGPISQRYKWCCNNGCGECTPVLVEFRTYHSTLNGVTDQERTEPRMVSPCCGEGMFLWDTTLDDDGPMGYDGTLAKPATNAQHTAAQPSLLATDHQGMRVDYSGLLGQCRRALSQREPANAEMLRQLQGHLQELGQRWYAGDTAVVDEILQLYCIEREARQALKGGV